MAVRTQVDPRIETSGAAMMGLMANVNAEELHELTVKHDLIGVNVDGWYPTQKWFDVFDDINKGGNSSADLVAIGMGIVDTAITPPGFETADLPTILGLWNEHYMMNHRSPIDIGGISTERVSEKHIKVILTTLYPDDLCYGMTYAYARRTVPKGTHFNVKYDETEPRLDQGGHHTVIHVTWG